ncbi:MAG: hypothetical protein R2751_17355 [Bacteroidales bacterium]
MILEDGKAELSFHTSDDRGYYEVLLEASAPWGEVCLGRASFVVEGSGQASTGRE